MARKKGTKRGSASPVGGAERSEAETSGDAVRGRPGRRSTAERTEAVLELLSGKATVDQLARRFGVQPSTVEGWRDQALEGISESLRQGSGKSARELELERDLANLEKAFTHLAIKHELVDRALKERPSRPGRSRR
ncbi:MAG: helix-turn-helix domain-containing protein [Candidatus Eisenbacteria bacterium]|uniref:Helix-turn-helix domain-containing protein n=1 Tax=Eiseniibacteriota bacterium TaxID=2212470 RepID=A0A956NI93_UNCEI|nr:helix-turn-helix domain-containing protein [Candidatus Eisenbacteria bacterium]MCP5307193.1 helix-turn-helix domain-containing protein [Chromatiaceae bacterium]MCP5356501.1 helix-turn-helix domain-containing protein [Paracoccaceae bacterium]